MTEASKGYQYQWFRYHWEGADLREDQSTWEMAPFLYKTKEEAKKAAAARSTADHTQTRVVYFDGEDWHYQDDPLPQPDFEGERQYFGSWITHDNG